MEVRVLRSMTPDEVRAKMEAFRASYAADWERWLDAARHDRAARFAAVLRSWQAARPLPMRRPRAGASHEPPYIEDLLDEAEPHLAALGDVTVADLPSAGPAAVDALHGLWAVFTRLPQRGAASCVGITKAVMLVTYGRIGPAFDSLVRKAIGLRDRPTTSGRWVDCLLGIADDVRGFEAIHGPLAGIVPERYAGYHCGRLYDMILGPGTAPPAPRPDTAPVRPAGPIPCSVDLREKLRLIEDHWNPRIVGELNGQHVKLVKFRGEFVWHRHDHEDELFLVVHGRFRMEYRDRHVWLEEGQFLIVPRGVEHRPVADEEVHVLLFEPAGTLNTGDARDGRTVVEPERI